MKNVLNLTSFIKYFTLLILFFAVFNNKTNAQYTDVNGKYHDWRGGYSFNTEDNKNLYSLKITGNKEIYKATLSYFCQAEEIYKINCNVLPTDGDWSEIAIQYISLESGNCKEKNKMENKIKQSNEYPDMFMLSFLESTIFTEIKEFSLSSMKKSDYEIAFEKNN